MDTPGGAVPFGVDVRQRKPRAAYVVAVDLTGSTQFVRNSAQLGVESLLGDWTVAFVERLIYSELEEQALGPGAWEIASFTGDGVLIVCDDEAAAKTVVEGRSMVDLDVLEEQAARLGVAHDLRLRTAITYGPVHESAVRQTIALGNEAGAITHERLRLHFGSAINLACRLLRACPNRRRYGLVVHESAWSALQSVLDLPATPPLQLPVRDFGRQLVYCLEELPGSCGGRSCGDCPELGADN